MQSLLASRALDIICLYLKPTLDPSNFLPITFEQVSLALLCVNQSWISFAGCGSKLIMADLCKTNKILKNTLRSQHSKDFLQVLYVWHYHHQQPKLYALFISLFSTDNGINIENIVWPGLLLKFMVPPWILIIS